MAVTPSLRPAEHAALDAIPFLTVGLGGSLALLAIPATVSPLAVFTVQLIALVGLGIALTFRLAPLADAEWFPAPGWSPVRRRFAGVVVLVVIPTGVVALVTLASSAALRFDPSLQFLQLLSALDIAWAAAALHLGVRWWLGPRPARVAALALGALCVVSVWNYLRIVGFGPGGQWLVDGAAMVRWVLPFDVAAAVMAIGSVIVGVRRTT